MKKYCMDIVALVSLLLIVGLVVWNHQLNKNVCLAAPVAVSADVAGQPPVIDLDPSAAIEKVATPVTGGSVSAPVEEPASVQAPSVEVPGVDKVAVPGKSVNVSSEAPANVQAPSVEVPGADKVAVPGQSVNVPVETPATGVGTQATDAVSDAIADKPQVNVPSSLSSTVEDKVNGITEGSPEEGISLPGAAPATNDK